ncbi:MAG TPA: alpha/beta fold hydrolase [Acidimicrobiia bacterium]
MSAIDIRARAGAIGYARVGDMHVAYRIVTGRHDDERDVLLVTTGTASMEAYFEDAVTTRLLEGLSELGRLVVFDRRGIGLSDPRPETDPSGLDPWREDIEAVVVAAHVVEPVLVTSRYGASAAFLYADRHPNALAALVMLEPTPDAADLNDLVRSQIAGGNDTAAIFVPSRVDEPGFREWFDRAGAQGASPRLAALAFPTGSPAESELVSAAASRVHVPTLVLRRPNHPLSPPRDKDRALALVRDAVRVDLPGDDILLFGNEVDALLAETSLFVTGELPTLVPERTLAAILFSDLVGSTEHAVAVGDAHWKRLLDQHDEVARSTITHRRGRVVKVDGDGILALFDSASNAIRAARELHRALQHEGLQVRAGIHVGEVDHRGDDVSGIAVNIAARVMARAQAGELLVSAAVPPVVSGSGFEFTDRGEHELKGVPGPWRLYALDDGAVMPGMP